MDREGVRLDSRSKNLGRWMAAIDSIWNLVARKELDRICNSGMILVLSERLVHR